MSLSRPKTGIKGGAVVFPEGASCFFLRKLIGVFPPLRTLYSTHTFRAMAISDIDEKVSGVIFFGPTDSHFLSPPPSLSLSLYCFPTATPF